MRNILIAGAVALLSVSAAVPVAAQTFVSIGTGGQSGVYHVAGQSICRLVNRGTSKHAITCTALTTGGSVANLDAIKAGERDMGVAQSDWQFHAYNGSSRFKARGANKELRSVFSLYPESFTVIARADSRIRTFGDLKGKRVNVGNPRSGQRGTMEVLMAAKGWSMNDLAVAAELSSAEQAQALCDDKLDAIVFSVGHPNASVQEATTSCDAVIVPVTGAEVDRLVADNPFYAAATIPGGMYRGTDADTQTFGVTAAFVASTRAPERVVYEVVKAVFDNFDRFRRLHPAFANLEPGDMVSDATTVPPHDGAARYFREKGLM